MNAMRARKQRPSDDVSSQVPEPTGHGSPTDPPSVSSSSLPPPTPSPWVAQTNHAEPRIAEPKLPDIAPAGTLPHDVPGLSDTHVETPSLQLTTGEVDYLRTSLTPLTSREREVVLAICAGGTNEGIAERLCIALPTLRTHLMRLNQKLGTTSKGDVVRFVAAGLIQGYRKGMLRGSPSGESEPAGRTNAAG